MKRSLSASLIFFMIIGLLPFPAIGESNRFDKPINSKEIVIKYKKDLPVVIKGFPEGKKAARILKHNKKNKMKLLKLEGSVDIEKALKELKNDGNIIYAEPNYTYKTLNNESGAEYHQKQWGLSATQVNSAWTKSRGEDVVVAVLDTGVDTSHPDLEESLLSGFNMVDYNYDFEDDNGHGTHVAGIIAAAKDGIGITGVAPDAKILPVKVLNYLGAGSLIDIVLGIEWAVDNGANIINMSFGNYEHSDILQEAVEYAVDNGVLLVAATGNDGIKSVVYPAAYDSVIGVGATNQVNGLTNFSNFGPGVDIVAPGQSIYSTTPTYAGYSYFGGYDEEYDFMSGTSMAAPLVSGVLALIKTEYNTLNSTQITARLLKTAVDQGIIGFDDSYGAGLVNADKALGGNLALPVQQKSSDVYEDDNSYNKAVSITKTGKYTRNLAPEGDVDWFELKINKKDFESVEISVTPDSELDIAMAAYKTDLIEPVHEADSKAAGSKENLVISNSDSQYLKVWKANRSSRDLTNSYTLDVKMKLKTKAKIEAPTESKHVQGKTEIKGWALGSEGIKEISVYVDNKFVGRATLGLERKDVAISLPYYPEANKGGFKFALDTTNFKSGKHTLKLKVTGKNGENLYIERKFSIKNPAGKIKLESLKKDAVLKGKKELKGWALNVSGIKKVEIFIDKKSKGTAKIGLSRKDVAKKYPGYRDADKSGFKYSLDSKKLTNGKHSIMIKATGINGEVSKITKSFIVKN